MQIRYLLAVAATAAALGAASCATQSTAPAAAPPAAAPAPAPAPAASGAAAAIQARQNAMRQIGGAARALNGQPPPDVATVQSTGRTLTQIAAQLPSLFPAGSGPESGVPTRATAAIWSNSAGFAEQVRNFNTAAQALANASTPEAAATASRALGGTCGSCHSQFRGPATQ